MKSFNIYKIADIHSGLTVETYLKQVLKYSGRAIQKLTRQKGIQLNGKPAYLQKKLRPEDNLRVLVFEDTGYGVQPEQGTINILYEDNYLFVLNKPPGQLVHPAGQTSGSTLANYLAYYLQQSGTLATIRPIHRLDRDTSGCVIFAKDPQSQYALEQQLQTGILKRTYHALVKGIVEPPAGTINAAIGSHPKLPNRRAVTGQGDPAITHYRTISDFTQASLLELILETGRTHQIRVHLAYLGHPILGDRMYGERSLWINRQALHAAAVSFRSLADGREITITAPLPADFAQVVNKISQGQ